MKEFVYVLTKIVSNQTDDINREITNQVHITLIGAAVGFTKAYQQIYDDLDITDQVEIEEDDMLGDVTHALKKEDEYYISLNLYNQTHELIVSKSPVED